MKFLELIETWSFDVGNHIHGIESSPKPAVFHEHWHNFVFDILKLYLESEIILISAISISSHSGLMPVKHESYLEVMVDNDLWRNSGLYDSMS